MTAYICPVCGVELDFTPWDGDNPSDEICPCCGIQFGYADMTNDLAERKTIYDRWRAKWVEAGMQWRHPGPGPPPGWDPVAQLRKVEG